MEQQIQKDLEIARAVTLNTISQLVVRGEKVGKVEDRSAELEKKSIEFKVHTYHETTTRCQRVFDCIFKNFVCLGAAKFFYSTCVAFPKQLLLVILRRNRKRKI